MQARALEHHAIMHPPEVLVLLLMPANFTSPTFVSSSAICHFSVARSYVHHASDLIHITVGKSSLLTTLAVPSDLYLRNLSHRIKISSGRTGCRVVDISHCREAL